MTDIKWQIKPFNELSASEAYQILALRSKVFVVEQNCVYQDIDGKDQRATHVFAVYGKEVVAYARIFRSGDYFNEASIGRVVVSQSWRSRKLGHELMRRAISVVEETLQEKAITISAQSYLENFYRNHGFVREGEEYLEDGIPHIRMKR